MTNLQLQYSPLDNLIITSEKGDRISPSGGKPTVHEGIDFSASDGTNLYCAHGGNVIYSGFRTGYGNMIVIQDPESGQATLYAHLSDAIFNKGDSIPQARIPQARTRIGKTGNSGTKAFHLHFEILSKEVADNLRDRGDLPSKGGRLNPRTYIANSPFASMLSTEVHSRKLGLESREGDQRDNEMYRDGEGQMLILNSQGDFKAAPITFRGLGGNDMYEIPVSYDGYTTEPKYDENGNPVIDPKTKKQVYEEVGPQVVYSQDLIDDDDGIVIIKKRKIWGQYIN